MPELIRIAVVDAHPIFRQGLVQILRRESGLTVVGEGEAAEDSLNLVASAKPHILLLDIDVPGNSLESISVIAATYPGTRIVVLTASDSEENVIDTLKAGAKAYILKGVTGKELIAALSLVHNGAPYITPSLASRLLVQELQRTEREPARQAGSAELTDREQAILKQASLGKTNREIALELELSVRTIEHYMRVILKKLGVRNRVEAARWVHKVN